MEVKSKIWIEIDGKPAFGLGRKELLEAVDKYGSITKAAQTLGMSYRKAWSRIKKMEECFDTKFVVAKTGGTGGGGATITEDAKDIIDKYEKILEGINEHINKKFKSIIILNL